MAILLVDEPLSRLNTRFDQLGRRARTTFTQRIRTAGLVLAGAMLIATAAAAGPIDVALVEKVSGDSAGLEFMDYLHAGQTISLGARDTLVLSYMSSCVRETI